ncbi:hypothetical protein PIB30_091119 [Stylosanthes scabra]|uniref:Uncharacterized protein n=1 Tax=Stylosanthes scabra TaxID=79078 RepID=A0ABU6QUC8_9FABA|nr:hypothetical protein [Stylosanthes scabra]
MVKDLQEGMNQVTHLLHGSTILKHLKLSSPNGKREDLSHQGHRFMGGIHAHESWDPYALQRGLNTIGYNDPIGERQRPSDIRFVGLLSWFKICLSFKEGKAKQSAMDRFGQESLNILRLVLMRIEKLKLVKTIASMKGL